MCKLHSCFNSVLVFHTELRHNAFKTLKHYVVVLDKMSHDLQHFECIMQKDIVLILSKTHINRFSAAWAFNSVMLIEAGVTL